MAANDTCGLATFDALGIVNLVLLFLLMLGLGVTIEWEQFKLQFKRPAAVLTGVASQFLIMPLVTYSLSQLFDVDPVFQVGIITLGCSPGGAVSNLITFLVQADVTLSIAMTTASSILAMGFMPANLLLYLKATGVASHICLDFLGIALSASMVVMGTALGLALNLDMHKERVSKRALKFLTAIGTMSGFAILILGFVQSGKSDFPPWSVSSSVMIMTVLPVVLGMVWGLSVSSLLKLPKPSRVAVAVETSVQNKLVALAVISIILTGDERDKAFAVPIIYAAFAFLYSFLWTYAAWKLGWTLLDPKLSIFGAIRQAVLELELKEEMLVVVRKPSP